MPYRIRKIYPWQNPREGIEKDVVEFTPLTPLERHLGFKNSEEYPTEELEKMRKEQDLVEGATQAAGQRAEPGEAIITRQELRELEQEDRGRGVYKDLSVI